MSRFQCLERILLDFLEVVSFWPRAELRNLDEWRFFCCSTYCQHVSVLFLHVFLLFLSCTALIFFWTTALAKNTWWWPDALKSNHSLKALCFLSKCRSVSGCRLIWRSHVFQKSAIHFLKLSTSLPLKNGKKKTICFLLVERSRFRFKGG